MKRLVLTAASGVALCALLAGAPAFAQDHVDAAGMPTNHSTPAEQAQTSDLNAQVGANNAAADAKAGANDAQYQAQQQAYQSQLQQNQNAQADYQSKAAKYEDQTARYDALRGRYAAERAAYHRGIWPDRYNSWVIVERDSKLIGERVQLITGNRVGTVIDTAHAGNGHVTALLVKLDSDKVVWIDSTDVRYNRADGIVMTNLDSRDLYNMADERL
ncbi:MAG: hypothetical protein JWP16_163 [Alphaproteobacteria bacterium]|nr:hypothetical protein [Alphaproteobacteria bacterium]